jgi:hypothetical protein
MSEHQKPADGCLFFGSSRETGVEVVTVEFGAVKFKAHVLLRRKFRVEGTRKEIIELRQKLFMGEIGPLYVADEHLGAASLEELFLSLESTIPSYIELTFVHAEVMPP